ESYLGLDANLGAFVDLRALTRDRSYPCCRIASLSSKGTGEGCMHLLRGWWTAAIVLAFVGASCNLASSQASNPESAAAQADQTSVAPPADAPPPPPAKKTYTVPAGTKVLL